MPEKRMSFSEMLQKKHDAALTELLQNQSFRFYMSELLGYCRTFDNAFSEKGNVAAFNNGRQSVGQKIFNDIMLVAPDTYIKMCKEESSLLALKDIMDKKDRKDD